jgi:NAD(P)-dependent dehydrogenase (short-subunit alcohol dehydrogenase family)
MAVLPCGASAHAPCGLRAASHDFVGRGYGVCVAAKIPVGRVGTPEDIAYVFQFLASAEASYVNG